MNIGTFLPVATITPLYATLVFRMQKYPIFLNTLPILGRLVKTYILKKGQNFHISTNTLEMMKTLEDTLDCPTFIFMVVKKTAWRKTSIFCEIRKYVTKVHYHLKGTGPRSKNPPAFSSVNRAVQRRGASFWSFILSLLSVGRAGPISKHRFTS